MDKVLSARVDESVIHQIGVLANELKMTKKAIIEAAIKLYSEQAKIDREIDVFSTTFGAWNRSESAEEILRNARGAFNRSMERHHQ